MRRLRFLVILLPLLVSCGSSGTKVSDRAVLEKLKKMKIGVTDGDRNRLRIDEALANQKRIHDCMKLEGFDYPIHTIPPSNSSTRTYFGIASTRRAEVLAQGGGNTNSDPAFNKALTGDTVGRTSADSCVGKARASAFTSLASSEVLSKRFSDPRFLSLDKKWGRCMKARYGLHAPSRFDLIDKLQTELGQTTNVSEIDKFEEKERLAYTQFSGCLSQEDREIEASLLIEYGRKIGV